MIAITFSNLTSAAVAALMRVYDSLSAGDVHMVTSGTEYIASLDNPSVGATVGPSAASVFGATAPSGDVIKAEAIAAFAAHAEPAVPVMTDKATVSYEEYIKGGWTDALLIEHGYMVAPDPKPQAAPSTAAANPFSTAQGGNSATSTDTATVPPPPAPIAANSALTAAPPAPPTHPVPLDKNGIAWDARIHSGARTRNKDDTWKAKKGVDAATVAQVYAEQQARGGMVAAPPPAALNVGIAPPPPPPPNAAAAPPPPPPATNNTPPPPGAAPTTFVTLCQYATSKFKPDEIFKVCALSGLEGLGQVNGKEHLIPKMFADFEALR